MALRGRSQAEQEAPCQVYKLQLELALPGLWGSLAGDQQCARGSALQRTLIKIELVNCLPFFFFLLLPPQLGWCFTIISVNIYLFKRKTEKKRSAFAFNLWPASGCNNCVTWAGCGNSSERSQRGASLSSPWTLPCSWKTGCCAGECCPLGTELSHSCSMCANAFTLPPRAWKAE